MHLDYAVNITGFESDCENRSKYRTAILTERKYPNPNQITIHCRLPRSKKECTTNHAGFQETTVEIKGSKIRFYTTYLDYPFKQRRMAQVEAILEVTAGVSDPQVIADDFNTVPGADSIEAVTDEYIDSFASVGRSNSYTYPAIYTDSAPEKCIDYVFTDDVSISIENAGIGEETLISNYLPTVVDLRLD